MHLVVCVAGGKSGKGIVEHCLPAVVQFLFCFAMNVVLNICFIVKEVVFQLDRRADNYDEQNTKASFEKEKLKKAS